MWDYLPYFIILNKVNGESYQNFACHDFDLDHIMTSLHFGCLVNRQILRQKTITACRGHLNNSCFLI